MIVFREFARRPQDPQSWEERWGTIELGLVCCWLRGIEMATESPLLSAAAARGELPSLPWRGGIARDLKSKHKIGSLNYLAMWQGLRNDDLRIDLNSTPQLTCSRFGVTVAFTGDTARLLSSEGSDDEPIHTAGSGVSQ